MTFLSFPEPSAIVPPEISAAGTEVSFRFFGTEQSDLEIDFSRSDIPALVTVLLRQCAISQNSIVNEEFFWNLSVGKRLECLLKLAAGERRSFFFAFKCGNCRQDLELEMTLAEIAALQRESDENETVKLAIENQELILRKPSARDQQMWLATSYESEEAAARGMLDSLRIAPQWTPDASSIGSKDLILIEEALDEADPLINFSCLVVCPDCETKNDFEIDLTAFALGELHRAQRELLRAVHILASRYHWSEAEIFAVPHWRRFQYLRLIAEEKQK